MNKIQVDILGLSINPNSQRAYALLLKEVDGTRRLPIVIGEPEAQAIANELEGVRPQRPMTHDLLKNVIEVLGGSVREIVINAIKEGTFYATIVFDYSELEVDARPSDAIAIAVRCGAPMYVADTIMDEIAMQADDITEIDEGASGPVDDDDEDEELKRLQQSSAVQESRSEPLTHRQRLEAELDQAIKVEDYETAVRLRDDLRRLTGES
ncbi:MAG: bifunctional nuclease family protein [Candidatus Kapabacteria bacterium]|nr:bifunctional nuclease family protein [Candidatus Kapabacteria bacterium]